MAEHLRNHTVERNAKTLEWCNKPLPEVAPENEVGFVVLPGDVGALVEKLETLLTSEDRLRWFQKGAWQRYLSHHTPIVVAKRLREVFEPLAR